MRLASTLLLALAPVALVQAQSQTQTSTVKKTVPYHHATTTSTLPPNIPKVPGIPKPLYSLRYIDALIGTGPLAEPQKWYTVHYTGWLAKDGTKFDSSFDHPGKEAFTFPYGAHRVIPGWDTGFEGMHVGGKRRLFVPWQLAYGEMGHPPTIPAKSDLIFDVELVSFSDKPPAPKTPPAPPKPAPAPAPTSTPAPASAPTTAPAPATAPATTDPAKPAAPSSAPQTPPHPEGC
jgi:peptidylprolyl isomerase